MNLAEKAKQIRTVILDVDGVLTDGCVGYGGDRHEIKFFDVKDGHAIKLLRRAGIRVGILSGRASPANRRRAEELDLDFLYEGEKNKSDAAQRLFRNERTSAGECLYIGDDLVDIPVMAMVALGIAVGDATPETKAAADWTTTAAGGRGAVREVAVWLLKQQKQWQNVTSRYFTPGDP